MRDWHDGAVRVVRAAVLVLIFVRIAQSFFSGCFGALFFGLCFGGTAGWYCWCKGLKRFLWRSSVPGLEFRNRGAAQLFEGSEQVLIRRTLLALRFDSLVERSLIAQ